MKSKAILLFACIAVLLGCLSKETRHTLYLDGDGALTWVVLEEKVHWSGDDPAESAEQESAFVAGVRSGEHPVALALDSIGARRVETRLLRDERPYAVWTEARFTNVTDPFRALLALLCRWSDVDLIEEGERSTLLMQCLPEPDESRLETEAVERLAALFEDREAYRIVLTAGQFVDARCFEIDEDQAVLAAQDEDDGSSERQGWDEIATCSLTWVRDPSGR